jgi:hypothetical protein
MMSALSAQGCVAPFRRLDLSRKVPLVKSPVSDASVYRLDLARIRNNVQDARAKYGSSRPPVQTQANVSDRLERWFLGDEARTLGSLIDLFGEKSFAVVFVVLMAVPALPLPTGGVTHVFEVVTMLLALELIVGRRTIWLPQRLRGLDLAGRSGARFASELLRRIRWLERFSHPRLRTLVLHRLSGVIFGITVFALSLVAFVAPPFSGLDTLPALGVVVVSLGVLLEDFLMTAVGLVIGAIGALLVFVLGSLAVDLIQQLF